MAIPDMPNAPPQYVPVIIAQANQAQAGETRPPRMIGVCAPVPNHNYSLENVIEPIIEARTYFSAYENRKVSGTPTVAVLQQPKHGLLRMVTEADRGKLFSATSGPIDTANPGYAYLPEQDYDGKDNATILVDFGADLQVRVKYYFQGVIGLGSDWEEMYCRKTGTEWKISFTLDTDITGSPLPRAFT